MALHIRDAAVGDLPSILEIANEAIANTTAVFSNQPATLETQTAWLEDKRAQALPVLVAEEDGRVAGYASLSRFRAWPGYARTVEHSVYVETSFRGRGVGARLLDALVQRAAALGHHAMIAGIEGGNAASIALHERAGFQEVGRLPEVGRKFDRWLDLVFMHRLLPDDPPSLQGFRAEGGVP